MIDLCCEYVCSYHTTYAFQSEFALYSGLNVKQLLAQNKREIGILIDCNWSHLPVWPVWLNSWVFLYELSGSLFDSSCTHLNFRFRACFEKGVPWHSGNCECGFTLKRVRDMLTTYNHSVSKSSKAFGQLLVYWTFFLISNSLEVCNVQFFICLFKL